MYIPSLRSLRESQRWPMPHFLTDVAWEKDKEELKQPHEALTRFNCTVGPVLPLSAWNSSVQGPFFVPAQPLQARAHVLCFTFCVSRFVCYWIYEVCYVVVVISRDASEVCVFAGRSGCAERGDHLRRTTAAFNECDKMLIRLYFEV